MATPLQTVYDAFLGKISSDEWFIMGEIEAVEEDWKMILQAAIFKFRFPRVSLEIQGDYFVDDLGNSEIQLLATYMKEEWLTRNIANLKNLDPLFIDKDFSPANYLARLIDYQEATRLEALRAFGTYDRSRNGKPFDYSKLAGKKL